MKIVSYPLKYKYYPGQNIGGGSPLELSPFNNKRKNSLDNDNESVFTKIGSLNYISRWGILTQFFSQTITRARDFQKQVLGGI